MQSIDSLRQEIADLRSELLSHRVYAAVDSPEKLRLFMEAHVFAVWDFMSLAKRLQRDLTCVRIPWTPPRSPAAARFINEIVTSEESDLGPDGKPMSHLELYIAAMEEVGAGTKPIKALIREIDDRATLGAALAAARVPEEAATFLRDTIAVAKRGTTVEVAAAFLFGREDVIPEMFGRLLEHGNNGSCSSFRYYLLRHVELDSEEHAPLAECLLEHIAGTDREAWSRAAKAATRAINSRVNFWDSLLRALQSQAPHKL